MRGVHGSHRHLVAGQRPGLVGADDRHRAEGLDRRQLADDGVAPRHALHADRQGDGHDSRQAFGDRRDRQADHDHEGFVKLVGMDEHGVSENRGRHRQHRQGDLPRELGHLPDQRGCQALHPGDQGVDPAEFGRGTRRDDDTDALTGGDEGSGERHGKAVAERRAGVDRGNRLVDRHRLAGQDRLVDPEAARLDQPEVGRHPVTGLEQHDVARHHRLCRDGRPPAVPQDRGVRIDHGADRLQRPLRASLLDEADDGVGDHHGEDHQRVRKVAERARQHAGRHQHVDQQVVELQQEPPEDAPAWRLRQPVRPVDAEPAVGLVVGEPGVPAPELDPGRRLPRRRAKHPPPAPPGQPPSSNSPLPNPVSSRPTCPQASPQGVIATLSTPSRWLANRS